VITVVGAALLQAPKLAYREQLWKEGISDRTVITDSLQQHMSSPKRFIQIETYWPLICRLNQGKITEKIFNQVPTVEYFAEGETFKNALLIFIPRIVWPEKPTAESSNTMFTRYTGHPLWSASMGLGHLGECYVNFGFAGGLLAFGIYGLVLGLISRFWLMRGSGSALWWPWFVYVMYWTALKTESDFTKGLNWALKAALIFLVIGYLVPCWRSALRIGTLSAKRVPKIN